MRFLRLNPKAAVWASRLAGRSSSRMEAVCGLLPIPSGAPPSSSRCQVVPRQHDVGGQHCPVSESLQNYSFRISSADQCPPTSLCLLRWTVPISTHVHQQDDPLRTPQRPGRDRLEEDELARVVLLSTLFMSFAFRGQAIGKAADCLPPLLSSSQRRFARLQSAQCSHNLTDRIFADRGVNNDRQAEGTRTYHVGCGVLGFAVARAPCPFASRLLTRRFTVPQGPQLEANLSRNMRRVRSNRGLTSA